MTQPRRMFMPPSVLSPYHMLLSLMPGDLLRVGFPDSLTIERRLTRARTVNPRLAVVDRSYDQSWVEIESIPLDQDMPPTPQGMMLRDLRNLDVGESLQVVLSANWKARLADLRRAAASHLTSQRWLDVVHTPGARYATVTCRRPDGWIPR